MKRVADTGEEEGEKKALSERALIGLDCWSDEVLQSGTQTGRKGESGRAGIIFCLDVNVCVRYRCGGGLRLCR